MQKFTAVFLSFMLFYSCLSQDTNAVSNTKSDTIQLYKKTHSILSNPFFAWNRTLFKVSDTLYDANELKPLMRSNKQAYLNFKAYRTNYIVSGIFSLMCLVGIYRIGEGVVQKTNILPPVGATIATYLLSNLFLKQSKRKLTKSINLYNKD